MFKCVISIAFFLIKDDPNNPSLAEDIVLARHICDSILLVEKKREERGGKGLGEQGGGGGDREEGSDNVSKACRNPASRQKTEQEPLGLAEKREPKQNRSFQKSLVAAAGS